MTIGILYQITSFKKHFDDGEYLALSVIWLLMIVWTIQYFIPYTDSSIRVFVQLELVFFRSATACMFPSIVHYGERTLSSLGAFYAFHRDVMIISSTLILVLNRNHTKSFFVMTVNNLITTLLMVIFSRKPGESLSEFLKVNKFPVVDCFLCFTQ